MNKSEYSENLDLVLTLRDISNKDELTLRCGKILIATGSKPDKSSLEEIRKFYNYDNIIVGDESSLSYGIKVFEAFAWDQLEPDTDFNRFIIARSDGITKRSGYMDTGDFNNIETAHQTLDNGEGFYRNLFKADLRHLWEFERNEKVETLQAILLHVSSNQHTRDQNTMYNILHCAFMQLRAHSKYLV